MLDQLGAPLDGTVLVQGKHGDGTAAVLSGNQGACGLVHTKMRCTAVTDVHGVQQLQFGVLAATFDLVGSDGVYALQIADGIEHRAIGMHREETRSGDFRHQSGWG